MNQKVLRGLSLMLALCASSVNAHDFPNGGHSVGLAIEAVRQEQDRQVSALFELYEQSFHEFGISRRQSALSFELEACMDAAALSRHALIIRSLAGFNRMNAGQAARLVQMDMAVSKVEAHCMAHSQRTPHITGE